MKRINLPGIEIQVLKSSAETDGHIAIFKEKTGPNHGPPLHTHDKQTEVFHVLKGRYRFHLDGEIFELGPGDIAVVKPGQEHAFKNISDSEGEFIFELCPALDADIFFDKLSQLDDPIEMARIFEDYGGRLIGPSNL